MKGDLHDPKALIREAYRIEAITQAECRTIFLDWALGVPAGQDIVEVVRFLLDRHAAEPADHPMTVTLLQALQDMPVAQRRGGRAARLQTRDAAR
jgi:hypothetical protein